MKAEMVSSEITQTTTYHAVTVEVKDGDKTHSLAVTVTEAEDSNNGYTDINAELAEWETEEPTDPANRQAVIDTAMAYAKDHYQDNI